MPIISDGNNIIGDQISDNHFVTGTLFISGALSASIDSLVLDGTSDDSRTAIQFKEAGEERAKISINSSNNLEIHQQFTNKHIVFKVNDAGTTREAFRMDGAVPEVVVNQSSDSLVDFRVETNSDTHALFVDGGNEHVRIDASQGLHLKDLSSHPNTPSSGFGVIYVNGDTPYFKSDGGTATSMIAAGGGGSPAGADTQIQFNDGGSFGGATKLLYDESNGRLKIGDTNAPQNVLDVFGNVSDFVAVIDNDASSTAHGLKVTSDGDGAGTNILDLESGQTTLFRVRGDGRVGIGKVSSLPSAVLTVSSSNDDSDIAIAHKIHHIGDSNTSISFDIDQISFEAGGTETLQVTDGEIHVAQYIRHMGDTNTHINFTDDKIVLKAGNIAMVTMEEKDSAPHEVTINDGGNNIDFVVEDNSGATLLMTDASTSRVGIGIEVPETTLHVHADSINNGAVTISQSENSGDASQLDLLKSRGSGASPAAVENNDFIGQVRFVAFDGNSYDNFADIFTQAAGTISTTSHPTKLIIRTTQASSTSPTTAVTIDENQDMTVAGKVYGKMMHMTHHRYNDGSGSGKEYIPWSGTSEQASPNYISQGVAPYAGKLLKVLVRSSNALGSTTVGIHINVDGNSVINSSAEEVETVTMGSANTTGTFSFSNANHFGPGDIIGVSIDPSSSHGNVNVTCVWEYEISS